MPQTDKEYFERRIREELAEAERCDRREVEQIHLKLAELYQARIEKLENGLAAPTHRLEVGAIQAILQHE